MTIREQLAKINKEISDNIDMLDPITASKKLIELSNLYSHLNHIFADADYAYRQKLMAIRGGQDKPNIALARLEAEASEEHKLLTEIKNERESLIELIRSLKIFIKANQDEMWVNKHI